MAVAVIGDDLGRASSRLGVNADRNAGRRSIDELKAGITRKKKLLEKQKKGNTRMRERRNRSWPKAYAACPRAGGGAM